MYPVTLADVLAAQLSVTLDGNACAVKLTPETDVFAVFTRAVEGVNVNPVLLGATTYEPLLRPGKLKLPVLSVVVDAEPVPDRVNVAGDPFTVPERLQV